MAKKPWLKLWVEWIHDPKMFSLTWSEKGMWCGVMTLAQECAADGQLVKGDGTPLTIPEIANSLHITSPKDRKTLEGMISKMAGQGSLHWNSNLLVVTHFAERQAKAVSETPQAVSERQQRRRAKMWEEYGIKDSAIPLETRLAVIERDKCLCQHCGKEGIREPPDSSLVIDPEDSTPFEFDHIIPRARGGTHNPENLLLSCRRCNRARRNLSARALSQNNRDSRPRLKELKNDGQDIPTPPPEGEGEGEGEKSRDINDTNLLQTFQPEPILAEISKLYEENCGIITPILAEKFKDFVENYHGPVEWIDLAFAEAVEYKNRRWDYVEAILYSWQEKGGPHADRRERGQPSKGVRPKPAQGRVKPIKRIRG